MVNLLSCMHAAVLGAKGACFDGIPLDLQQIDNASNVPCSQKAVFLGDLWPSQYEGTLRTCHGAAAA